MVGYQVVYVQNGQKKREYFMAERYNGLLQSQDAAQGRAGSLRNADIAACVEPLTGYPTPSPAA